MPKISNIDAFIKKARLIHGNKYDYSKSIYLGIHVEMKIICQEHGEFLQTPRNHLKNKCPCNVCLPTLGLKTTLINFVNKANGIHNNKYDYSRVIFSKKLDKIIIICPTHGEFTQTVISHFSGNGCSGCTENIKLTKDALTYKANIIHNYKYDYSLVEIRGGNDKITIICPDHGKFYQVPRKHLLFGCSSCAKVKKLTTNQFIDRANIIHNNKYNYEKSVYIDCMSKLIITCMEHGDFSQSPNGHLMGNGCLRCSKGNSSILESKWLDYLNIPNDKLHRNVRLKINDTIFIVDGYYGQYNIIYEFLGDYWHGNPSVYNLEDINKSNKKTFGELFTKTKCKIQTLRKNGFKVICIWEKDFNRKYNI